MDWALHQQQVRFDIRAERAEYEYLFKHQARVLQDRLPRRGGGDRTKEIPIAEWEKVYRKEAQARRLLHQARVLAWGKEKRYYYAHKQNQVTDLLAIAVGTPVARCPPHRPGRALISASGSSLG